jgi:hypothetical protein
LPLSSRASTFLLTGTAGAGTDVAVSAIALKPAAAGIVLVVVAVVEAVSLTTLEMVWTVVLVNVFVSVNVVVKGLVIVLSVVVVFLMV